MSRVRRRRSRTPFAGFGDERPGGSVAQDTPPSAASRDDIRRLADELDATPEQIEEAIAAVGPRPADIEMHLKGSRSTTNSDRVRDAGG
jgi:hypothetical protein